MAYDNFLYTDAKKQLTNNQHSIGHVPFKKFFNFPELGNKRDLDQERLRQWGQHKVTNSSNAGNANQGGLNAFVKLLGIINTISDSEKLWSRILKTVQLHFENPSTEKRVNNKQSADQRLKDIRNVAEIGIPLSSAQGNAQTNTVEMGTLKIV